MGAAIATGLSRLNHAVTVLDGGDTDFRSSRGNFGLVWVQGKGAHSPAYAQWTGSAAKAWPEFAAELLDATGVDVQLQQTGGIDYCLTESEFQSQAEVMRRVQQHTDGLFEYQMLDNKAVRELVPQVSEAVVGASYSPQDGHVNPLKLLKALHINMQKRGCKYLPDQPVINVEAGNSGFTIETKHRKHHCEKIVLASGLANTALADKLGMSVPLKPNQGQLLITERFEPFLAIPGIHIRQTDEGTLQIGDSHADIGYDDSTSLEVLAMISNRLLKIFPHLAHVNVQATLLVTTRELSMSFQQSDLQMFKVPAPNSLESSETVVILIDGQSVQVPRGVSVAAALLLTDIMPFRHSRVDQSPRAPYCLMGVCAECLLSINGLPGQFACQITVQDGMRIDRDLSQKLMQESGAGAD